MRMNQDERRFDFHGLGAALKRAREEKGWTLVCVDGYSLGWGKNANGQLKNKYLAGWRWM